MIETERGYDVAVNHITQLRTVSGQAVGNKFQVRAMLSCGNEVVIESYDTEDEATARRNEIKAMIDNL